MSDRTTLLSGLLPYLVPQLPKCPAPLINQSMIEVIRDFCHETQAWRYDVDPIYVRAGVSEYDLDGWKTSMAVIDAIISVKLNGSIVQPVTWYSVPESAIIKLVSEPTESRASALEVTVSLQPARAATLIDADMYDRFCSIWCFGILADLMLQPGRTWTNPQVGAYNKAKYEAERSNAKGLVMRGFTNRTMLIKPARFV